MKISTASLLALSAGAWWALGPEGPAFCPPGAGGCGLLGLTTAPAPSAAAPRGRALETHTTEIFAGGCIVSSEEDTYGRYVIRAWQFEGGQWMGQDLEGLRVAAVEYAGTNLAKPEAAPEGAIIYLPEDATPAQQAALRGWVATRQLDLRAAVIEDRVVPLAFDGAHLKAGDWVEVRTVSAPHCGGCGEQLWYAPRTANLTATRVDVTEKSMFRDDRLGVVWNGGNRRSSFVGTFGGPGRGAL